MGKRSTKVKKPTEEFPPLRGVIEKGAIRPAFPYDAERLDSFRNNASVLVWISYDGDRPLIRKWWAILGWYLKNTTLPWSDKETASAAIKLALTMIEPFQLPSGQWAQYPQSLTKFDDAELEGKIREMQQLLYEITGVDQETMRREGGSLGDELFETNQPANDAGDETLSGAAVPPTASEEGAGAGQGPSPVLSTGTGATDSQADPAAAADVAGNDLREPVAAEQGQIIREGDAPREDDHQAGEASQGGGDASSPDTDSPGDESGPAPDDGGGADTPAAPPPSETMAQNRLEIAGAVADAVDEFAASFSAEDRLWLKQGAKMMLACQPAPDSESYRVLIVQLRLIRDIVPKDVSRAVLNRMETIRLHCTAVCKGEAKLDKALVASTALASLAEVEPEPVKVRN